MCAGCTGEGGGDWGGGEGLQKEAGQLGLGTRQSGESKGLGGLWGRSLCGRGSLQFLEVLVWCSWDLQGVQYPPWSVGGTYCGIPSSFERVHS
jgi:hypothetical protein